jgi:hypothetical protein
LPLVGGTVSGNITVGNPVASPAARSIVINDTATQPQAGFATTGRLFVASESASPALFLDGYNQLPTLALRRARGTAAAPAALQQFDNIAVMYASGYTGSAYAAGANPMIVQTTENWTAGANGYETVFQTIPAGATASVNSLILNGNSATFSGNVTMAGADFAMNNNAKSIESDPAGAGGYVKLYGPDSVTNPTIWLNGLNGQAYDSAVHNFRSAAASQLRMVINATGTQNISGTWGTISDTRAKANIEPYDAGLQAILALDPIRYDLIADEWKSEGHVGFAAEQVVGVLPHLCGTMQVKLGGEDVELQTVAPTGVVFALVNAVKELKAEIEALKTQLAGAA